MAFMKLEGDTAVLTSKGRFYQVDLYTFHDGLFAKHGSSFIRLRADGGTSVPDIKLTHLTTDATLRTDQFNRLVVGADAAGAPISADAWLRLTSPT